ncbi:hypothetical protein JCM10207_007648 [Rhodosporidiobolus poonsookiae]
MSNVSDDRAAPAHFEEEMLNKHFEYTYDNGWKYEFWVKNHQRIVYKIHGGPMNGRSNYQTAYYQRVRAHIWQISWVEETGTTVTITLDQDEKRLTTTMIFSAGHWEFPEKAHGYKREKLEEWRKLAEYKPLPQYRHVLTEQATIDKIYGGRGELEDIEMEWPTL